MIRLIGYSPRAAEAPTALPGIGISAIGSLSFYPNFARTLVVEELHLDCVLVGAVADARRNVRVGTLDVEVMAVRIPRQTGLPAVVVVRIAGSGLEVLMLVANPGHEF